VSIGSSKTRSTTVSSLDKSQNDNVSCILPKNNLESSTGELPILPIISSGQRQKVSGPIAKRKKKFRASSKEYFKRRRKLRRWIARDIIRLSRNARYDNHVPIPLNLLPHAVDKCNENEWCRIHKQLPSLHLEYLQNGDSDSEVE
jgi:hypothetical protein